MIVFVVVVVVMVVVVVTVAVFLLELVLVLVFGVGVGDIDVFDDLSLFFWRSFRAGVIISTLAPLSRHKSVRNLS